MCPQYCIFLASVFPEDVIHHISSLLICKLRYISPYLPFEDVNVLSTTHRRSQVNEMQAEPKLEGFIRPGTLKTGFLGKLYRFIEILIVILVEYQPFIVEGAQISNPKRFLKQLFCAAVSADNLHPRASARKVFSYKYGIAPYRPLI